MYILSLTQEGRVETTARFCRHTRVAFFLIQRVCTALLGESNVIPRETGQGFYGISYLQDTEVSPSPAIDTTSKIRTRNSTA